MTISKLDVVNACLALQGEAPANSLADYNPAIASALDVIARVSQREQARGWWFNKETITVYPNADTFYYVPTDVIGLVVGESKSTPWLSMRGRRLYDNPNGAYLTGTGPQQLYIIRNVAFEELPFHAANLIRDAAVLHYASNFDGDQAKIATAEKNYRDSRVECNSEHIRAVSANMLTDGGVGLRRQVAARPVAGRRH